MKQLFTLALILICSNSFAQNLNISTLKMGPFSIKMPQKEAESIANRKLIIPTEQNEYKGESTVYYEGESIKISLLQDYTSGESDPSSYMIYSLSTQSKKFKTKSNVGVGSSRNDLINAYRDYPNFSVYKGWTEEGERSSNESYFTLNDMDAGTTLSFKMVNNIVVEISIYFDEGGC